MEDVKTGSLSAWVEGEWPWLGISIGGWPALWFLAPLLRSVLGISDRSPDTNLYINVLILSTIHSVFAVALAILCTIDPSMAADRVYGQVRTHALNEITLRPCIGYRQRNVSG